MIPVRYAAQKHRINRHDNYLWVYHAQWLHRRASEYSCRWWTFWQ